MKIKYQNDLKVKEEGIIKIMKKIIFDSITQSSLHGLPKITAQSSLILQIIYTLCFFVCLGYCIVSCILITQKYRLYQSTTKISIVQEVPTNFPAISFCNSKLLNRTNPLTVKLINDTSALNQVEDQYRLRFSFANIKNLTSEERKEFGFKLENMLLPSNKIGKPWCFFNNDFCDVDDFTYFYNPAYGNCYSFNIGYYNNGTKYEVQKSLTNDKNFGFYF